MSILTTTRLALRYPDLAELVDLAHLLNILAVDVDTYVPGFKEGLHSARGAAAPSGRFYWETDTTALFYTDGTTWRNISTPGSSSITSAMIVDGTIVDADLAADTLTARVIAANAIGASELADNAVDTAAIIANAVTPAKTDLTGTWNFTGLLEHLGLRLPRHPYGAHEHICRGRATMPADTGSGQSVNVVWDQAFASTPFVVCTPNMGAPAVPMSKSAESTTGATFVSSGAGSYTFDYIAIGPS